MQLCKYLILTALVSVTLSGCALKQRSSSRFDSVRSSSGQCSCFTCRNGQAHAPTQAHQFANAQTAAIESDCGCDAAPVEYAAPLADQGEAWPVQIEDHISPLSTQPSPQLELPSNELPGKIDAGIDEFKYIERPGSLELLDTSLKTDEKDLEEADSEFVGIDKVKVDVAPAVLEETPELVVAAEAVPEIAATVAQALPEPKEVKFVEVANQSKAVILRARPVERHLIQRHAYGRTPSSPIRQVSSKKPAQGAVSLNGLRKVFVPLPNVKSVPAPSTKVAVKPIPTRNIVKPKPVLRLQAIATNQSTTPGLVRANLRKVDVSTTRVRSKSGYDKQWLDSSKRINYYVPAQPISGQSQRSADATFDMDRIEQTIPGAETSGATTELQTVDR